MVQENKNGIGELEFVALMAFLMSNVALCIDTILPALPDIGVSLQVSNSNHLQLVIILVFLGLGIGELLFGTLSDSFGRKPIVYVGVIVFIVASFLILWAPSLEILLTGRVFQGIGLSAARSVSIAIIRDTYSGNRMARIMSFIMTIFILVPMIAPLLGQIILKAYNWQAIFYFQLIFIGITITWFHVRQVETLSIEKRIVLSRYLFTNGVKEFLRYKQAVLYTVTTGLIQGSFITYLGSAQQIFQGQYQMEAEFPYIFGGLAFAFGLSNMLNGFFVLKYGMLKLVRLSLLVYVSSSLVYLFLFSNSPNPGIAILIGFLFLQFFTLGFIFGNLSALAMQPIGHIAGIGAAIFSFTATSMSVVFAIAVGTFLQDTVLPLFAGFFIAGIAALVLMRLSDRKNNQNEEVKNP